MAASSTSRRLTPRPSRRIKNAESLCKLAVGKRTLLEKAGPIAIQIPLTLAHELISLPTDLIQLKIDHSTLSQGKGPPQILVINLC